MRWIFFIAGFVLWPAIVSAQTITPIKLSLSNVYLIQTKPPILVDAGTAGDYPKLKKEMAKHGEAIETVQLVILTHAHGDHAGLASDLQKNGTKIMMGSGDMPMATAGKNGEIKSMGLGARLLKPFVDRSYTPFTADITLAAGEKRELMAYGWNATVIAMPGHTAGSLVILLPDHRAFIGDMILGGYLGGAFSPRKPREHYFQADLAQDHRNIRLLLDQGVEIFYPGHGGPLARADVLKVKSFFED